MRLAEVWESARGPTVSFELFPARDPKAAERLDKAVDTLVALRPDFFSVTFGAGGSSREGSRRLVDKLKNEKGLEVLAYFACWGLGPQDIGAVLDRYRALGVENLLAVRGDPPREDPDLRPHPQSLAHASDLLAFIRPRYGFCLGAAGYPEGHVEATSREMDLEFLKLKVDSGAKFVIANYCYDNRIFFDFLSRCRAVGIQVPILPGVMPIFNVKMMENLAKLCGATITDQVRAGLAALPSDDPEAVGGFGIEYAFHQCQELLQAGVPGIHFYTMDRSKSVAEIVRRLRSAGLLTAAA